MRRLAPLATLLLLLPALASASPVLDSETDRGECSGVFTTQCMVEMEHTVRVGPEDCILDGGAYSACFFHHECHSWAATEGTIVPIVLYDYCGDFDRKACVQLSSCSIENEEIRHVEAGDCLDLRAWAEAAIWGETAVARPADIRVCVDAATGPYLA